MYEKLIFIIERDFISDNTDKYDVLSGDIEIIDENDTEIKANVYLDIQFQDDEEIGELEITGGVYQKEDLNDIKEQYKLELNQ